jgi:DNA invertase Pin-like site-specific DNA recombinase
VNINYGRSKAIVNTSSLMTASPTAHKAAKTKHADKGDSLGSREGHLIGYARVSTTGQDTATQKAKLKAAGCTLIRTETVSGGSRDGRSELASILEFIRPDDVLIVVKLDRLGRNTRDVLNLVHELEEKGASMRVLEPAIETDGPMGRVVLTVLGMVAEMELGFIRDRQRAGIDAAKAKGVYKGRPVTFDRARIVALRKQGMGATEIAKAVGCKRGNVYKALKSAGLSKMAGGLTSIANG